MVKLFLVGFMGSGKTTVGRALGERLRIPFFDLDELIEASEGRTIREIFEHEGEAYFRKREHDLLLTLRYTDRAVVATGGGTFAVEENMELIQSQGLSIYLAAPFPLLLARLRPKVENRPMFRDEAEAKELFLHRLKYYRTADVTVEIREGEGPEKTAERLLLQVSSSK